MNSFIIESNNVRFVLQSPNVDLLPHEIKLVDDFVWELEARIHDLADGEYLEINIRRLCTTVLGDVNAIGKFSEARFISGDYDRLYYSDSDSDESEDDDDIEEDIEESNDN